MNQGPNLRPLMESVEEDTPQKQASDRKQTRSEGGLWERFKASSGGQWTLITVCVLALLFGGWQLRNLFGSDEVWPTAWVMDPETKQTRLIQLREGLSPPYRNPSTGEDSMYPVEYCFRNSCGPEGGTPVVLNDYLGVDEPTSCWKCGAPVIGHNPRPEAYKGVRPRHWDEDA